MKKNITINLFGSLYAIDEDAYELLNQYQKNMQRYFSRQEGGEEIAEDIERRIAELFDELKASGVEAITIEHMQEIIKRIGNPEEMDNPESENLSEGTEEPHEERKPKETTHKKLFRNPDDKMLGGVTSGLACFFGIDPLWLRLLMILFAWFSLGTMIVIYLILWIITPEAQTPEDRLRMQGRPVNMENLRDEIMEGARKAGQYATAPETKKTARGCLTVLLDIITAVFKGCLFVFIGGLILILSIVLLFALVMLCLFLISACCGRVQFVGRPSLFQRACQRFHRPRHLLDSLDKLYCLVGPHFVYRRTFHLTHGRTHSPNERHETVGTPRDMGRMPGGLHCIGHSGQCFL